MDLATPASTAAAVAAAIAAIGSWLAARKANNTSATIAAIERHRRHDELTPEFDIACTIGSLDSGEAYLHVELSGGRFDRYDNVTISTQDNFGRPYMVPNPPIGLDPTEEANPVWGPWEFKENAGHRIVSKRQTRPQSYSRSSGKNWDALPLRRTQPTAWMTNTTPEKWRERWDGWPLRILVTCDRDGNEPWLIQRDVAVELQSETHRG